MALIWAARSSPARRRCRVDRQRRHRPRRTAAAAEVGSITLSRSFALSLSRSFALSLSRSLALLFVMEMRVRVCVCVFVCVSAYGGGGGGRFYHAHVCLFVCDFLLLFRPGGRFFVVIFYYCFDTEVVFLL
jgi:hypothetical protein